MDISSSSYPDNYDHTDYELSCQDKSTSTTDLPSADSDGADPGPNLDSSSIAVDAVHPLFTEVFGTRRRRTVGTSTTEDRFQLYFCEECDTFVYKTLLDITNHFICRKHASKHACVYCGGPVFTYLDNRRRLYHHKCDNISPSNCDQLDWSTSSGDEGIKVNGAVKDAKDCLKFFKK